MAKHWIQGAITHPGAERRAAAKAGMSTHAYEEKHKHDSGTSGRRARLGLELSKMNTGGPTSQHSKNVARARKGKY